MPTATIPALDPSLCRARQEALRALLAEQNLDAALLVNRHYVHALTGYWHEQPLTLAAVLVTTDGNTILAAPGQDLHAPSADEHIPHDPQERCTIVENVAARLARSLLPRHAGLNRIGTTGGVLLSAVSAAEWVDITSEYQYLRRRKDPDEVALLRHSVQAAEAACAEARRLVAPGLTELDLYVAMQSAATRAVGEPLSAWGNDFQCNSPGGPPRNRPMQSGEIAVLDIGVGVRGYRSDLCRSFAVDGNPTATQREAHARVLEALARAEERLRPGTRCRELFDEVHALLEGWNGCTFFHHLGHGIGLDAHEVPRLNPFWDDTLQPGDVIAVEPGLYGDALRAGLRLEQNYLVTTTTPERLSHFPLDL